MAWAISQGHSGFCSLPWCTGGIHVIKCLFNVIKVFVFLCLIFLLQGRLSQEPRRVEEKLSLFPAAPIMTQNMSNPQIHNNSYSLSVFLSTEFFKNSFLTGHSVILFSFEITICLALLIDQLIVF